METVQLAALIKSTIMALQHANQTGNYSVLRDLGTPVFRERFDLAQLTAIFSNLRSRSVNLSPVLFLAPNLTKQPELTEGNQLASWETSRRSRSKFSTSCCSFRSMACGASMDWR